MLPLKTVAIVLALGLAAVPGLAIANPPDDPESAFVLDLQPAGGTTYHLHCKDHTPLSKCEEPAVWQNTNALRGLQTGTTPTASGLVDPDTQLTP